MKIIICILFCVISFNLMCQELSNSDRLHLVIPSASYIIMENSLELLNVEEKESEYIILALGLTVIVSAEVINFGSNIRTQKDIELGVISLASSYYINKGYKSLIKIVFKKNKLVKN